MWGGGRFGGGGVRVDATENGSFYENSKRLGSRVGGGQIGCERRIEVFVKIIIFFFFGGGGGGGGGSG